MSTDMALMAKAFDGSPSIILWGMGGLCYSQAERQTPATTAGGGPERTGGRTSCSSSW